MSSEDETKIKAILQDMQKLGFTKNDSKIYTTLLGIGLNSPAVIAEKSGVDRARVYDSLKRLVKKGAVEEEPVPRAPRYRAKPPKSVFKQIIEEYEENIDLATKINKKLEDIDIASKIQNSAWAIRGKSKIKDLIIDFLQNAEDKIYLILTDEYARSIRTLQNIADILLDKVKEYPKIKIKICLYVKREDEAHKTIMSQIYHSDIKIFHWVNQDIIPFGLVMNEKSFLQTFLSTVSPKPKYEFGIWMENCSKEQLMGFLHLCEYVFSNLCKKVVFSKKQENE